MRYAWMLSVVALSLTWPTTAWGQDDKGPPVKEPPADGIAAWKKAGGIYGGMRSEPLGVGLAFNEREHPKPGEWPAFMFLRAPVKGFATLPAIDVPFGLFVHDLGLKDRLVKDLVGLKQL